VLPRMPWQLNAGSLDSEFGLANVLFRLDRQGWITFFAALVLAVTDGDKCPLEFKRSGGTFIVAEWLVNFHLEQLPEGGYLATCATIPGLVAQGRTVTETLEIARDVAKKLHEARLDRGEPEASAPLAQSFELPVVLSA